MILNNRFFNFLQAHTSSILTDSLSEVFGRQNCIKKDLEIWFRIYLRKLSLKNFLNSNIRPCLLYNVHEPSVKGYTWPSLNEELVYQQMHISCSYHRWQYKVERRSSPLLQGRFPGESWLLHADTLSFVKPTIKICMISRVFYWG